MGALEQKTQDMYIIELKNVTKEFTTVSGGKLKVIDNLTIGFREGKLSVVIGPSGCGKSTILNIIAGITIVNEGQILIDGIDINSNPDYRRKIGIGYVFQQPRLLEWRTLRENIIFALKAARKIPKNKWSEIANNYLKLVGLEGFENFYPLQVSGGMQQRASIARAFAINPRILLMDEPFSHLDEITAEMLRNELIKIWSMEAKRKTIVFVTHDLREAVYLADEIFMLTPRPARLFKHYVIDIPHELRSAESEELFNVFKNVLKDFQLMIRSGENIL
jgi:ABC-type nitrate/sulfonate/bicarbonate transport system ATPase subunit